MELPQQKERVVEQEQRQHEKETEEQRQQQEHLLSADTYEFCRKSDIKLHKKFFSKLLNKEKTTKKCSLSFFNNKELPKKGDVKKIKKC